MSTDVWYQSEYLGDFILVETNDPHLDVQIREAELVQLQEAIETTDNLDYRRELRESVRDVKMLLKELRGRLQRHERGRNG